jgi:uncharacterized protein YjbI with pentapeptide repeats
MANQKRPFSSSDNDCEYLGDNSSNLNTVFPPRKRQKIAYNASEFSKRILEGQKRFRWCFFEGLQVAVTNLQDLDFSKSEFQDCDLSGRDMRKSRFCGCILRKINLSNADLSEADLSGCDMSDVLLIGANLTAVNANNLRIEKSDLKVCRD